VTLGFRDVFGLDGTFFGTISGGPVLAGGSAAQRDSAQTFLVDVGFDLYDPAAGGLPVAVLVEWSIGSLLAPTTWHAATANPYDRLHTAGNPPSLTGVPGVQPAKHFNFAWNAFVDLPEGFFEFVWVRITVTDISSLEAQLVVGPIAVSTTKAQTLNPLAAQLARRAAVARSPLDLLGNGLDTPFRRGPRDFVSSSGPMQVRARVRQIFSTRAAAGDYPGELPWRPDFGHKFWTLQHRNNTRALRAQASTYAREALRWEKTVHVIGVDVVKDPPPKLLSRLLVHTTYEIRDEDLLGAGLSIPQFTDTARVAA
jgi:phage baseplate assembly protein W